MQDEIRANNTHLMESLKLTALANADSALNTPVPSGEAKGAKSTVTAQSATKTESAMDLSK